jgi:hypothetical protein
MTASAFLDVIAADAHCCFFGGLGRKLTPR